MIKKSINQPILASVLSVFLLLSGCATVNLDSHVAQTPSEALELAAGEDNRTTAQQYLLRIASRFQSQRNHEDARTILESAQLDQMAQGLEGEKRRLAMISATALDDSKWAKTIVAGLTPDAFLEFAPDQMAGAADLQSRTYELAGDRVAAAMTLMLLAQTDPGADIQQLHDRIWQLLQALSDQELANASAKAIGYENQGWLELAALVREPGTNLDEQGRIVRGWQNNWPGHPAAQVPPSELQLIATLATSRPEKIALALPLEGPFASAGKAIRDGFLSAYYMDQSADRGKTDIRVINTSGEDFAQLYSELLSGGFDLIVGPLEKEALAELADMNTLPVPALGLNYLPEDATVPDGLYQYGLSAEDEARQIADRLIDEGLDHVLMLIPQGEWGDRVERTLLSRLQQRNGIALDIERFFPEDNLRTVTADLLGITASRNRAIQAERTIGIDVEFEARRRQDADAIVMVAEPTVARQFKPLFAFYFGGDLPVYSPSIVYGGSPNPSRDRDLNDVIFTDIPWVLGENNELRAQAREHLKGTQGQLGRLFAMGADAWQLSKRLPLLRQLDSASIDGQTGVLTMTRQGSIHRRQLWARFSKGSPELLPEQQVSEDEQTPTRNSDGQNARQPGTI
ncbi:MAG: penicillin-binding protein activator [Marinobacter sp.]|uniref:penicillin-binding protein activator n=1 Tax=Marinobacter sp. TaxID=50741 RepID=UPI00396EEEF4